MCHTRNTTQTATGTPTAGASCDPCSAHRHQSASVKHELQPQEEIQRPEQPQPQLARQVGARKRHGLHRHRQQLDQAQPRERHDQRRPLRRARSPERSAAAPPNRAATGTHVTAAITVTTVVKHAALVDRFGDLEDPVRARLDRHHQRHAHAADQPEHEAERNRKPRVRTDLRSPARATAGSAAETPAAARCRRTSR